MVETIRFSSISDVTQAARDVLAAHT